jgi:hypothetical protein
MISAFLMGGLGNQLFQIFTTIAYGFQEKVKIVFPYAEVVTTGAVRQTYWTNFLSRLIPFTSGFNLSNPTNQDISIWERIRETNFGFNELPTLPDKMNYILVGYWQSYKYFDKLKDNIFNLIQLEKMRDLTFKEYQYYFGTGETIEISMHFRLGDYKKLSECHPILPKEYYFNALTLIKQAQQTDFTTRVLYFCEAEDNQAVLEIIEYLKPFFSDIEFIKVDDSIPDWKQMLLMSCCDNNIIANSSFSWWGAYMNIDPLKIVCYPDIWFGPRITMNMNHDEYVKDMYPPEWKKISTSMNT